MTHMAGGCEFNETSENVTSSQKLVYDKQRLSRLPQTETYHSSPLFSLPCSIFDSWPVDATSFVTS